MTRAIISPGRVSGTVTAPAGKSAMQRACALALLNNGKTVIRNAGKSDDDLAAIQIIKTLGADVTEQGADLLINSQGIIKGGTTLRCGESGLSMRMFAAIASLSGGKTILEGSGSLLKRPMHFFDDVFSHLGINVETDNGFLPVRVKGKLTPADITIDGSASSQYLTGLLFAFAKAATKRVIIHVNNLKSIPYIDLSIQMLNHFGYAVSHEDYRKFIIDPVPAACRDIDYTVEADWSGASFLLVAGAIAGDVRVKGLDLFSLQADRAILEVFEKCGVPVGVEGSCLFVNNSRKPAAFEFDASHCPDLFPPLATLASCCKGTSVIRGVSRLSGKESDRGATLLDTFLKMGIDIRIETDDMIIKGADQFLTAKLSSHDDHRIAMACAIAALRANGPLIIDHADVVKKSYPDFFKHLELLGVELSLTS